MTDRRRPMTALRVRDLDASLRFYVEQVGCSLAGERACGRVATIEHRGYLLLLAGPEVDDLTPHLHPAHEVLRPGATVFFNGGASDRIGELHAELGTRGVREITISERWWGDHTLDTFDPDGYKVRFWTSTSRMPAETLDLYEAGSEALERALGGLDDAGLDRSPGPGEWTIRQIVHHLAGAEASALGRMMLALAEPGSTYVVAASPQDTRAERLAYAGRDIVPAVALFRAIRRYMTECMRHLPDAWECSIVSPEGHVMTAGTTIALLMSHAFEHIEEIERIAGSGEEAERVGPCAGKQRRVQVRAACPGESAVMTCAS